ncbi:hypothetical protein Z517_06472 [Fonsecaea pedrosoi CBS 271.37]|uniref:Protein kinase domain-containing protein n=1 Tax=Fonsecaea pedrosoi CBS 271.37 TaxID=1442368 RepID=A0A0D2EZT7_9EURO|nr:uncharacterized protein Z517_06472 [Fonsecaea pedrosoi CBS 271.37]KIW79857.1 hypothetical protein Z517_06472 [Fonsecaea pedrosoi CBS 271.37]
MSPMQKTSNRDTVFPGSGGDYLANIQRPNNSNLPESQVESSTRHSRALVKSTTKSGLRDLYLPLKYKTQRVNWREDSPWSFYEGAYRIELGGSVAVVLRSDTGEQFTLSSASITEEQIKRLCELKHKNLVQTYEVFSYEGVYYTVSNHEAISLNHFIACDKSLNEAQLASIFAQSLEGIAYLATHGLRHSEIICPNILVSLEGVVKIANLELCQNGARAPAKQDLAALGSAVMSVMNKKHVEKGKFSIMNPSLWSSEAISFLSLTMDSTYEALSSHSFLDLAKPQYLPWIVLYALRKAHNAVAPI